MSTGNITKSVDHTHDHKAERTRDARMCYAALCLLVDYNCTRPRENEREGAQEFR
jgi:hypothetical protein